MTAGRFLALAGRSLRLAESRHHRGDSCPNRVREVVPSGNDGPQPLVVALRKRPILRPTLLFPGNWILRYVVVMQMVRLGFLEVRRGIHNPKVPGSTPGAANIQNSLAIKG